MNENEEIEKLYLDLLLYSSGELSAERLIEIEALLAQDSEARAYLETIKSHADLLGSATEFESTTSFTERAVSRTHEDNSGDIKIRIVRQWIRPLGLAAAVLLLLGICFQLVRPERGERRTTLDSKYYSSWNSQRHDQLEDLGERSRRLAADHVIGSTWRVYGARD